MLKGFWLNCIATSSLVLVLFSVSVDAAKTLGSSPIVIPILPSCPKDVVIGGGGVNYECTVIWICNKNGNVPPLDLGVCMEFIDISQPGDPIDCGCRSSIFEQP